MATLSVSIIGSIDQSLQSVCNLGFVSHPQSQLEDRPPVRHLHDGRYIAKILEHASVFAYPEESRLQRPIRAQNSYFSVIKTPYTSIENRVSSVFLERVRDFAHVYLHYLHQGWKSIPRDERIFRDTPHTAESVYMEKKQHSLIENGEGAILRFFANKAGCEIFKIWTYATRINYTIRLHGTRENISRLFRYIQDQAKDVEVKVPLSVIRASQIEGPRSIQNFFRKKNEEFLEKSRSFLVD